LAPAISLSQIRSATSEVKLERPPTDILKIAHPSFRSPGILDSNLLMLDWSVLWDGWLPSPNALSPNSVGASNGFKLFRF
jgi:hypothetical protein